MTAGRYILAAALLAAVSLLCLCLGTVVLSPADVLKILFGGGGGTEEGILLGIRLPRLLMALAVGASLSVSGVIFQAVLKNVNGITGNVNETTEDLKRFSKSVGEIGDTVSGINALVGGFGSSAAVRASSLGVGIRAPIEYFITHLMSRKKGVGHEG